MAGKASGLLRIGKLVRAFRMVTMSSVLNSSLGREGGCCTFALKGRVYRLWA